MENPQGSLPPLATLLPFEAAARLESFTRAAAELGITQAAVSRQIRALEADLGAELFERRNRGVFLTAAGRAFGRTVSGALQEVAADARRLRGGARAGEVILHCQLCEAFYWLMPRLADFHQRHPRIDVQVSASTKPLVEAGRPVDVAIQTSGRAHGAMPLAFTASDEIFPVCSPAYRDPAQGALPLEALPAQRLLAHRVVPQDWLDWDDWLAQLGASVRVGAQARAFDSYPLVLQAAAEGHGIALGWRRSAGRMLADGTLIRPCAESLLRPTEISVFADRRQSARRPEVAALLAWLQEQLADAPGEGGAPAL